MFGMGLPPGNPNRNHKDNGVPTGAVLFWGSETDIPPGWVLLDGSTKNKDEFPDLFEYYCRMGFTTRSSSTFTLHEVRGRMPIFAGDGPSTTDRNVGDSSGVETVTLTTAEMPAHAHPGSTVAITNGTSVMRNLAGSFLTGGGAVNLTTSTITATPTIASQGSGGAFNIMNPFFCFAGIQKT